MTSSPSWSELLLGGALVLVLLGGAPAAQAAPRGKFLQRYEEGLRLYKAERYSEAIEVFRAAYALKQLPRVLFNIGQAHLKLGNAQEALRYYEQYLKLEPRLPPEIKSKLDTGMAQARASLEAVAPHGGETGETPQEGPPPTGPPAQASSGTNPPAASGAAAAPVPQGEAGRAATGEGGPRQPAASAGTPVSTGAPAQAPALPLRDLRPVDPETRLVRGPRPVWRLASGGVLLAGGATLLGFGASALSINGQCIDAVTAPAKSCHFDYATQPLGLGLLIGGVVAIGAGVVLVAWPGPHRRVLVQRAATAAPAAPRRSL